MANLIYPPVEDWDHPKEPRLEGYELTVGWAIFTGKEGEDSNFAAFIENEETAFNLIGARYGEDNEEYFFDACAIPAAMVKGVLYVANDYRVDTHQELVAALRAHGLLEAHEKIPDVDG